MHPIEDSELILNPDGSVYHLHLLPGQIAGTIIIVGDQDRVPKVTKHFDSIEFAVHKREFYTQTGIYKGKRLTVLSTGIGTDNIDIVFNELDALVNIDLKTRLPKEKLTSLNIIRIGTSGSIQPDLAEDTFLASEYGFGMDGLGGFYCYENTKEEKAILAYYEKLLAGDELGVKPYLAKASEYLLEKLATGMSKGITLTATGFYGPQGRELRLKPKSNNFIDKLSKDRFGDQRITNLEMETSAIYLLAKLLGHKAISFNALIANRYTKKFSIDPDSTVEKLIVTVLDSVVAHL